MFNQNVKIMMDYIELSSIPVKEDGTDANEENACLLMSIEALTYIDQLIRVHGLNPDETEFRIHETAHEFGVYIDVRFYFDGDNLLHNEYAINLEKGSDYWDKAAITELRADDRQWAEEGAWDTDKAGTDHDDVCSDLGL
jgi:hypothetical protein